MTYEQAKAAHERGEKVEQRVIGCVSERNWFPYVGFPGSKCEFRLAPVPASEEVPYPRMKEVNYAQAVNAFTQGISVECTRDNRKTWEKVIEWKGWQGVNAWRISDPYAELKAAQAQGKVIQLSTEDGWMDIGGKQYTIGWQFSPDRYRVKPDEPLKIEAGKEYELSTDERKFRVYAVEGDRVHGALFCGDTWMMYCAQIGSIIAPWTDAAAPYDNWQHVPSWAQWQALDAFGWSFFEEKPEICESLWLLNKDGLAFEDLGHGHLPIRLQPTNFTGEWQSSLQERP